MCQFSRGFENFHFDTRKGKCAHGMATFALQLDHSSRVSSGELHVPRIGWRMQVGQPIDVASIVFSRLSHHKGERFLVGFRIPQDHFGIRRQCVYKENRDSVPVDRLGPGSLEELLSVEICTNDLNRQLKFGGRCIDRIGHSALFLRTQSWRIRKTHERRRGPCGPKLSIQTLPPIVPRCDDPSTFDIVRII